MILHEKLKTTDLILLVCNNKKCDICGLAVDIDE